MTPADKPIPYRLTPAAERMHAMRSGALVPSCACVELDFRDDGKALRCERCKKPAVPR